MINFRIVIKSIKYKLQRIFREYSDDETWNLDYTITKFILPRLKLFKKLNNGYPAHLTEEQWSEILDKMIKALENIIKDSEPIPVFLTDEEETETKEGLKLFGEYFRALWW